MGQLCGRCWPVLSAHLLVPVLISLVSMLTGCATTPVQPAIELFADSVTQAASAGETGFKESDLEKRVTEVLREEMAAVRAIYGVDTEVTDRCRAATPFVADPAVSHPTFPATCPINGYRLNDGKEVLFSPILPSYGRAHVVEREPTAKELVNAELQARRSIRALKRYAEALTALATSEAPTDVGKAASDAVVALGNAASTAASIARSRLPGSFQTMILTGSSLIAGLTREALEVQRHKVLTRIVRDADPTVTELTRRISIWFFLTEKTHLDQSYKALEAAINDATPGVAADLLTVDAARDAARAAHKNAKWRTFWQIAIAHRAILGSLDAPSDFAQLIVANQRIQTLADSAKAFVVAVEKSGEVDR